MATMSIRQANAVNRASAWLLGALPKGALMDLKLLTQRDDIDPCDISIIVGNAMDLAYNANSLAAEEEHRKKMELLDIINKHSVGN